MLLEAVNERGVKLNGFQWAPTLGGECYRCQRSHAAGIPTRFNGHPPLGVNATWAFYFAVRELLGLFQWAPTLGGECYGCNMITINILDILVSMGTHPWG